MYPSVITPCGIRQRSRPVPHGGTIGWTIRAAFAQYTVRYMEQVQPGCFLCAVITPPLVAAMISAQNETYLRRGGWESPKY